MLLQSSELSIFGLSENIISNMGALFDGDNPIVTVPHSRIPFSNATRPGSIDLSHMGKENVRLNKYIIRGRSKITVDNAAPITDGEMSRFLFDFEKIQKHAHHFPFVDQERLAQFIQHCKKMVRYGETFNAQASWLSSTLWPHLFQDIPCDPIVIKPMEDLTLDRENILENIHMRELLEIHLKDVYGAMKSTYFYYGSCVWC